jgi:hypothetical protein
MITVYGEGRSIRRSTGKRRLTPGDRQSNFQLCETDPQRFQVAGILNTLYTGCASVLFVSLILLGRVASAETGTMAACYGERIEVVFPAVTSQEGTELPAVHLSLPSPDAWLIGVRGSDLLLEQLPCREEPVAIREARVMGIDPRLGHVAIPVAGAPMVRVQMIRIGRAWRRDLIDSSAVRDTDRITSEGTPADDGFLRIIGTNTDAVGGGWLFPESYLSPFGNRISIGCAVTCATYYGLDPETRLSLSYRLLIEDTSRQPDWIAIDQSIRALVQQWIEDR